MTDLSAFDLSGRSIVVIGATGALGSAVAIGLAAQGAELTLTGANASKLNEVERRAADLGAAVVSVAARPETPESAEEIIGAAAARFGRLDGLVVASGTNKVSAIVDMDPADFDAVMSANVRGTWLVCRAFGKAVQEAGGGASVVLVSSTRGLLGHPAGYSAYCASKGAVNLLTRTLAAEWGAIPIRVNSIAPTVFRSDLTTWMYSEEERGVTVRNNMLSRIPIGRLAEPDDMVGPVAFFLSDASAFCTGQILYVDGGYTSC